MSHSTDLHINVTPIGESGPRVVFLHGLFGQGKNFTTIAKGLQPELRSLLIDVPNHGRSDWTESFDYVEIADLIADRIREETDGEPVHLLGHSLGGKAAMVLALRHPDLIDRLVVVDISPVSGGSTGEFEHLLGSLRSLDLGSLTRRADAEEALTGPIPNRTVRSFLLQNLRSSTDGFRWQANLDMLYRDLPAISAFPEFQDQAFDHPVLWIAGSDSPYIRPEHEEPMRRLFPRTRLVTIKDAGHWVHSQQPEVFTSALRQFLGAD